MNLRSWRIAWERHGSLAIRNVRHWWQRSLLLVLLIAVALTSYLATALFGRDTLAELVPAVDLGLDEVFFVQLSTWAYPQVRFLQDPMTAEVPERETRYRPLVTDEPGSELTLLRQDERVQRASVARRVTLEWPWGTAELLSGSGTLFTVLGTEVVRGRAPAALSEIMVSAAVADLAGLDLGAAVPYLAIDPATAAYSEGVLEVVGVYEGGNQALAQVLGWLPASYGPDYLTDLDAHSPRVLANFEPNCYLIELKPRADEIAFSMWLVETYFVDSDGYYHLHRRYPVVRAWNDAVALAALDQSVGGGTAGLGGIMTLALGFVGVGALTVFLLTFLERRREIAVLKTVGYGGADIAALFGLEVAVVGLAGLVCGLGAGHLLIGVWQGRQLPPSMIVAATVATLFVLLAAAALPVAMASAATVTELLVGRRVIAVWRQRVGAGGRSVR